MPSPRSSLPPLTLSLLPGHYSRPTALGSTATAVQVVANDFGEV